MSSRRCYPSSRETQNGLSIQEIIVALHGDHTRRTIQRRLHTLIKQGEIVCEGEGRGVRYRNALLPAITASQIKDPFEQAFFLMVHLPYLQSFEDVNKRTSRLAANIPLLKQNFCPISFITCPFAIRRML